MCLDVSKSKSKQMQDHWTEQGLKTIPAWKIGRYTDGRLRSMYYPHPWTPGVNVSDIKAVEPNARHYLLRNFPSNVVLKGIHVYVDKQEAIKDYHFQIQFYHRQVRFMKVECPVDQFMGCDCNCQLAAFRQVILAQEEYDRLQEEHAINNIIYNFPER